MAHYQIQVILAPSEETPRGVKSVFLAGTTTKVDAIDWRVALAASLSETNITVYNPYRVDWDNTWREDVNFPPYRQQVEWELDKQEKADMVVIYFHPATQAPISLLELGLCARKPGKAIVLCPQGYWKTGTNSSLFNFSTDKDVLCSLGRAPSHLCSFTTASYAYLVLHPHLTTLSLCP